MAGRRCSIPRCGGEKKRERLSLMRASWTDYFRFKTLWLDDITITLLPAAPRRDRQGVRAFENLCLKMVGLGTDAALSRRT